MDRTLVWLIVLSVATVAQVPPSGKPAKAGATHSSEATAQAKDAHLPSEETVNAFLRETFGYNPALTWKITSIKPTQAEGLTEVTVAITTSHGLQSNQFYVTSDGKHAIAGEIIPFGSRPFDAARVKLEREGNGFSRGPADAPVTIFEFSDLQCPHCKEAQPMVDKLMSEEKNVKLVFQNFPLVANHDWAEKGAAYADCIGRNSSDAAWKFIQGVYDAQSDITASNADDKLKAIATAAGANSAATAECAAKPATLGRVEHSVELGNSVGVTGTPTLFINGRSISNMGTVPYDVLKQLVEFAAKDVRGGAAAK